MNVNIKNNPQNNNLQGPNLLCGNLYDRNKSVISFILSERLLTLTVIGSVFTFQFLSATKINVIDPIFDFIFADDNFNFMNLILRDGVPVYKGDRKIIIDFGAFFKEFIKWFLVMTFLFLCAKYTRLPDDPLGNILGAAIM